MINNVAKPIMKRFGIEKFVETGVFMADTFLIVQDWFVEFFGDEFNTGPWQQGKEGRYTMYEVENDEEYVRLYLEPRWQQHKNVKIYCWDSPQWLKGMIDNDRLPNDKTFFFLDAHQHKSPNPEPLRDEITQILRMKNVIISVDDWYVPSKNPDIYNLDQIRDLLKGRTDVIYYSDKHNFHGKWMCFIFLDRYAADLDPILKDLPLIKEML